MTYLNGAAMLQPQMIVVTSTEVSRRATNLVLWEIAHFSMLGSNSKQKQYPLFYFHSNEIDLLGGIKALVVWLSP